MIKKVLIENVLKGRKTKPITNAILKRHPITFYYSDSNTDKDPKDRVKPGTRIRSEVVALGLSKKGNQIVRGYVESPSVSKKGFNESGWRTFRVDRMSNIKVLEDETFDERRPQYKDGEESKSGPMDVTYVTTDWNSKKDDIKSDEPTDVSDIEPTNNQPEPQPTSTEEPVDNDNLPEPEIIKPSQDPTKDDTIQVPSTDNSMELNLDNVNYVERDGAKYITQNDYDNLVSSVYKSKEDNWKLKQNEVGRNLKPGQGTRRKFEYDSSIQVSDFIKKNNIKISNELNENILRIKTLML